MKRIVMKRRFGNHHESFDASDINRVSLPLEPWHQDAVKEHKRPRDVSIYHMLRPFGASGNTLPDWRE